MFENIDGVRGQLKQLIDERATVWTRMQELAFKAETAEAGLRSQAYDEAEKRLDQIDAEVAKTERLIARVTAENEKAAKASDTPIAAETKIVRAAGSEVQYRETFTKWLRDGMSALTPAERSLMETRQLLLPEQRALAATTTTAGGFTVPQGFVAKIVDAMDAFGGLRGVPQVTKLPTADGGDLPIPTADDTGNTGELLGENVQAAEGDMTFGQVVLKSFTWSSKIVRVSLRLLNDSGVDIEAFLAAKLGQRIGRAQAPYFITGTGSGQPEGILTGTTSGVTTLNGQQTTLIYKDFVDVEHSVAPPYRKNGAYLLSDGALKAARLILDTTGRPIWTPGMVVGVPNQINGFPYFVDQEMPAVAAGETPVLFGDLSYYWFRNVQDIQLMRLAERYADYLQVGFIAFERADGRKVDAGDDPYKTITMDA